MGKRIVKAQHEGRHGWLDHDGYGWHQHALSSDAIVWKNAPETNLPETVKAADGVTDLHRFNVTGVIYAPDRAEAQRRLTATNTHLDHAEIVEEETK